MKSYRNTKISSLRNRLPIHKALASLLISSAASVATLMIFLHIWNIQPSTDFVLAGVGILAATIGIYLKLAKWWIPILLLFPSALGASLYFAIPSWIYLVCFVVLLIVYWNAAGDRVPLYLTNTHTWAALDALIDENTSSFIDIGCGIGGGVIYLGRRHPTLTLTGIETAPIPYLISKLRVRFLGLKNVSIRFQDMWAVNLQKYDIVYCFLSPEPMSRLFKKTVDEMHLGSTFISNSFAVPNHAADTVVHVDDARQTKLLIWRR